MNNKKVSIRVGDEVSFDTLYESDDMIVSEAVLPGSDSFARDTSRQDIDSYHSSGHNYKLTVGEIGTIVYIYIDSNDQPRLHVKMNNGKEIDCNSNRVKRIKTEENY